MYNNKKCLSGSTAIPPGPFNEPLNDPQIQPDLSEGPEWELRLSWRSQSEISVSLVKETGAPGGNQWQVVYDK